MINSDKDAFAKRNKFALAGSSLGFAGGIAYAFTKKTGFWKGWGFAILGGIALSAVGAGIDYLVNKPKTDDKKQELGEDKTDEPVIGAMTELEALKKQAIELVNVTAPFGMVVQPIIEGVKDLELDELRTYISYAKAFKSGGIDSKLPNYGQYKSLSVKYPKLKMQL